jgi:hypothetical protein
MISAYWLIPAVIAGAVIGVLIVALCAASGNGQDGDGG